MYPSVCLDQLCKRFRGFGVRADLDKLHTERVGMMWASFDLIPSLDEHFAKLVCGIISYQL